VRLAECLASLDITEPALILIIRFSRRWKNATIRPIRCWSLYGGGAYLGRVPFSGPFETSTGRKGYSPNLQVDQGVERQQLWKQRRLRVSNLKSQNEGKIGL
jgi:hypothetical protein